MATTEAAFRDAYGQLVAATWSDPSLIGKLKDDPAKVLGTYGISVPGSATVRVVEMVPTGEGDFGEQWEDWQAGEKSGTYDLFIPSKPKSVGGGAAQDTNTTCTPCCTCT
ncbi:MAG: hypothetical protein E6G97_14400 [Alphaproteobacteria bacterium]|nr:MAG: hypothetical protein E6G97_14400 [Alphaproteobacteria bacterium]